MKRGVLVKVIFLNNNHCSLPPSQVCLFTGNSAAFPRENNCFFPWPSSCLFTQVLFLSRLYCLFIGNTVDFKGNPLCTEYRGNYPETI